MIIEVGLAAKHLPFDSFIGIWGSVIADSLVAIGVFGELLFSAMGSRRHGELQRRSKLMVAEATSQAAEAHARASEANQKAQEAASETERLKGENLAIQQIIRPRRLPTGGSFPEKYDELAKFADTPFVVYVVPDFGSQLLASDVWNVLARAGWKPEREGPVVEPKMFDGVTIYAGDSVPGTLPPKLPDRRWLAGAALSDLMTAWKLGLQGTWPMSQTAEHMLPIESFPRSKEAIAVTVGMPDIFGELMVLRSFGPPKAKDEPLPYVAHFMGPPPKAADPSAK